MSGPARELALDELPGPPIFRLVDGEGRDVRGEVEVSGEPAMIGVLFADEELAREFSADASEYGVGALSGLEPRELPDWGAVEDYAAAGGDYVLAVSREGTGLFHAGDVARWASEMSKKMTFPLYVFADEAGESPLISVEVEGEADGAEEALVAPLFTSPERARAFKERAAHLALPDSLGAIEDEDGLRRHALVARRTGAGYVTVDPESGATEAIPVDDLIRW